MSKTLEEKAHQYQFECGYLADPVQEVRDAYIAGYQARDAEVRPVLEKIVELGLLLDAPHTLKRIKELLKEDK